MTNLGKRKDRIKLGDQTAQLIYGWLRQCAKPSDAMNVLCAVQALMVMQCRDKSKPLDETQIRVMMGNMTDNVVQLIMGEENAASEPARPN